jgi:putative DNA methylase
MGQQLMAIVADGSRGRVYLPPDAIHVRAADAAEPTWRPDQRLPDTPRWFSPPVYGMPTYGDLFTLRQLVALTTFSNLVGEARERVLKDAMAGRVPNDNAMLNAGGTGATAYADAVAIYLALALDRVAERHTTIATWDSSPTKLELRNTVSRQAIPMS